MQARGVGGPASPRRGAGCPLTEPRLTLGPQSSSFRAVASSLPGPRETRAHTAIQHAHTRVKRNCSLAKRSSPLLSGGTTHRSFSLENNDLDPLTSPQEPLIRCNRRFENAARASTLRLLQLGSTPSSAQCSLTALMQDQVNF